MASQTITGPDLQYTQDNKRGFAYSGIIKFQNSAVSVLEFISGSSFFVGQIGIFTSDTSSNNWEVAVSLNDIDIIVFEVLNTIQGDYLNGFAPMDIIIPPATKFKLTSVNTASSSEMTCYGTLIGRVYEHLPVRN